MRGEVRAGDPAASLAMRSPGETPRESATFFVCSLCSLLRESTLAKTPNFPSPTTSARRGSRASSQILRAACASMRHEPPLRRAVLAHAASLLSSLVLLPVRAPARAAAAPVLAAADLEPQPQPQP